MNAARFSGSRMRMRSPRRAPRSPRTPLYMDDIDRALADAWHRATIHADEAQRRLQRYLGPIYQRPLRSWALVLRAHDKRLPSGEVVNYEQFDDDGPDCAVSRITLTGELVRTLCGPITIPWPGVTINAAAKRFGVNRSTIHNWAKKGRIVMDVYPKRGGKKNRCSEKRVWTRSPLDPAGDVYAGPWGTIRQHLAQRVPRDFQQSLLRTHRYLRTTVMAFMRCPKCGKWRKNLYWPQPIWTLKMAMGMASRGELYRRYTDGFVCRQCAGFIYESVERRSRPASGYRVDCWDRFVKRISGGVLGGDDVAPPASAGSGADLSPA